MWLHVRAVDANSRSVFESGAYDFVTAELTRDAQAKVYETHLGVSPSLAQTLGLPSGPSFHFVLNDSVYFDNRIPPRGFTNAAFAAAQASPVGYAYSDGQYWDDTPYALPAAAESVTVTLYYQTASKEFVTFLRDANTTNAAGQTLYDAWATYGKSAPVVMRRVTVPVHVTVATPEDDAGAGTVAYALSTRGSNPFHGQAHLEYKLPQRDRVRIAVFDVRGRRVRSLVDRIAESGRHELAWDGTDDRGARAPSGLYLVRLETRRASLVQRILLLR
jgi:hypothetical protein